MTENNIVDILLSDINLMGKDILVHIIHINEVPRVVRLIEKESRMVNVRNWERKGIVDGYRVDLPDEKKSWSGCSIWKYLTRLNWKPKDGYVINFIFMGILPHIHTEPPLRVTTEKSGLIATLQMLPAHPAHLTPNNPG